MWDCEKCGITLVPNDCDFENLLCNECSKKRRKNISILNMSTFEYIYSLSIADPIFNKDRRKLN